MVTSPTSSPAKKVQYLCKQGGQTFLIEGSAVLEKLRAGGGTVQLRLPVSAVRAGMVTTSTDTKPVTSEGLASRLGSLVPATSATTVTSSLAARQAAEIGRAHV